MSAEIGGSENYNVTQNGIVIWTPKEKEILFSLLDRKGKNGIREIAEAIGTKSELEVQEHLKLLHRGLERQHLRDRHARTVILGDIPAATEVSGECGRALDKYAHLLCLEEQYLENTAGKQRHYDAWIIDRGKAEEIDEQIDEEDENEEEECAGEEGEDEAEPKEGLEESEDEQSEEESEEESRTQGALTIPPNSSIHLCANLFRMSKWIRLSERFFMNPGGPRLSDNWTKLAYPGETPSITADAFTDFYAVTMSLTRRLVQSSLFFAMSRIRQMKDSGGRRKARLVKSRDVRTALSVLNMKQDRTDFWTGLARRCHLDVVDARHMKGWKNVRMGHDEVEDYLSGDLPQKAVAGNNRPEPGNQENAGDMSDDDDESVLSDVRSSPEPMLEEQLYLTLEDEHAETIDQKTSNLEEQRLWQVLGRPATIKLDPNIKPEDGEDLETSRKPTGERKSKEDLVDWRDRTLYRSEWEEYGNEIFDMYEEISENRRKRRRIAREEPTRPASPVETISDNEELEMNTRDDDEEAEEVEIDPRTIKLEGGAESEEDHEAMDEHEDTIASSEENDQKPVTRKYEEVSPDEQNASRHSDEDDRSEYESDQDHKPHLQSSVKHEPEDEERGDEGNEGEGEESEEESVPSIKQGYRSSSEENDMPYYYQRASQDGLVKRE